MPTTPELVAALHSAFEWQYDCCDHGTYAGGPSQGQPYAMCEIFARRLADEAAPHCPTCICGRRAPVQGHFGHGEKPPGTIAWWEHEKAWEGYGHSQSAEDIARRGGFGYDELVRFLGHEPTTWSIR